MHAAVAVMPSEAMQQEELGADVGGRNGGEMSYGAEGLGGGEAAALARC